MKFVVKNLWNRIQSWGLFTSSGITTIQDISAAPKLPIARLDVSEAPLVKLIANGVEESTDICTQYFPTTLEDWRSRFSLVFPDSQEWGDFWQCWKHVL